MLEKRGKKQLPFLLGVCFFMVLVCVPSPATWARGRCLGRHSAPSGHCKASVLPGPTSQEVTWVLAKNVTYFLFLCGPSGTNIFHLGYVMNFI